MTILVITTKKLVPPEDGRADTILKLLEILTNENHSVSVLSYVDQEATQLNRIEILNVRNKLRLLQFAADFLKGYPLQVCLYKGHASIAAVRRVLGARKFDVVIADMARTSHAALAADAGIRIMDMDDLLSVRYASQAENSSGDGWLGKSPVTFPHWMPGKRFVSSWIVRLEAIRMARYERRCVELFDRVVLVSSVEAEQLSLFAPSGTISAIPNWVEISPQRGGRIEKRTGSIIYFGNLSTALNVDTVVYLVQELFPVIRRMVPHSKLTLIGREIADRVMAFKDIPGIVIQKNVPDISPYIRETQLFLCPMRFGSGVKTKILESLSLGTSVVTTKYGASGIPEAQDIMFVANDSQGLVEASVSVLKNEKLAWTKLEQARRVLQQTFSKEVVREKWVALLSTPPRIPGAMPED